MRVIQAYIAGMLMLFLCPNLFATEFVVIESQSYHVLHEQDQKWIDVINMLGYNGTIEAQDFLEDVSNLDNADVLIISSGVIDIPVISINTIKTFVENGGQLYIQSEYSATLPGNIIFSELVNELGGSFSWSSEHNGSLTPMAIVGSLADNYIPVETVDYFWYGVSGSGDSSVESFMQFGSYDFAFKFCPPNGDYGKVVTSSDQDWIRLGYGEELMMNIISFLMEDLELELSEFSIDTNSDPCSGDDVSFVATLENSITGNYFFEWKLNGQVLAGVTTETAVLDIEEGDIIEATILMEKSCGLLEEQAAPFVVGSLQPLEEPQFSINTDVLEFCESETGYFTSFLLGNEIEGSTYQWLLNGNPISDATNDNSYIENLSDQDVVSCQLIYEDLCDGIIVVESNELVLTIYPITIPTVEVTLLNETICEGDVVSFMATGNNLGTNPTFQWTLNGEFIPGNLTFLSLDNYEEGQMVSCSVISDQICTNPFIADAAPVFIPAVSEMVAPEINIVAEQLTACEGETLVFTAETMHGGMDPVFAWMVNGELIDESSATLHISTLTNEQEVSCMLTSSLGCVSASSAVAAPVAVNIISTSSLPFILISSAQTDFCNGETATFTTTTLENAGQNPSFNWSVNGELVEGANGPVFELENPSSNAVVSCELVVAEACVEQNFALSNEVAISVYEIDLNLIENGVEHCDLEDGTLIVEGTGGLAPYNYSWSNGVNAATNYGLQTGSYSVTIFDANGCTIAQTFEVGTTVGPNAPLVQAEGTSCNEENGSVEVLSPDANLEYIWYSEQGNVVSLAHFASNLAAGDYMVEAMNNEGCISTQTVHVEETSSLQVEIDGEEKVELGTSVSLEAISYPFDMDVVSYEWSPSAYLSCSDCPNPVATPENTVTYTLVTTSASGCTAVAKKTIAVNKDRNVFIPNIFSPDNDGINDYFAVYGDQSVAEVKAFKVFNRWGAVVYSNDDYSINDEVAGWNGTFRGKEVENEIYIYMVEVVFADGWVEVFKGDVFVSN